MATKEPKTVTLSLNEMKELAGVKRKKRGTRRGSRKSRVGSVGRAKLSDVRWLPAGLGFLAGSAGLELVFEVPLIGPWLKKLFTRKAKLSLYLISGVTFLVGRQMLKEGQDPDLAWGLHGAALAPLLAVAQAKGVGELREHLLGAGNLDELAEDANSSLAGAWQLAGESERREFLEVVAPALAGYLEASNSNAPRVTPQQMRRLAALSIDDIERRLAS